jgi:hypothetical protein
MSRTQLSVLVCSWFIAAIAVAAAVGHAVLPRGMEYLWLDAAFYLFVGFVAFCWFGCVTSLWLRKKTAK